MIKRRNFIKSFLLLFYPERLRRKDDKTAESENNSKIVEITKYSPEKKRETIKFRGMKLYIESTGNKIKDINMADRFCERTISGDQWK